MAFVGALIGGFSSVGRSGGNAAELAGLAAIVCQFHALIGVLDDISVGSRTSSVAHIRNAAVLKLPLPCAARCSIREIDRYLSLPARVRFAGSR